MASLAGVFLGEYLLILEAGGRIGQREDYLRDPQGVRGLALVFCFRGIIGEILRIGYWVTETEEGQNKAHTPGLLADVACLSMGCPSRLGD